MEEQKQIIDPTYSKKRLVGNIMYKMKEKGVKVGELEEAAQVSAGYFSRLKTAEGDDTCPSLETLMRVAAKLECSINTLLYCDYGILTETEKFIAKFLTNMLARTNSAELPWERESIRAVTTDSYNTPDKCHPLTREVDDILPNVYSSEFTDDDCELLGPVMKLPRGLNVYYLSKIARGEKKIVAYEMYLYTSDDVLKPVCESVMMGKREIWELMRDLYESAGVASRNLRIEPDVKKSLEEFMSGADDPLPF